MNVPEIVTYFFETNRLGYHKSTAYTLFTSRCNSFTHFHKNYIKEPVCGESYEYTPINIIVQTGGARSGHYRAYVKNNGSWYSCDDATIAEVQGTSDNPISAKMQKDIDDNAYVIFYKKISLSEEPQWAKRIQEFQDRQLKQQLTNLANILHLLQQKLTPE